MEVHSLCVCLSVCHVYVHVCVSHPSFSLVHRLETMETLALTLQPWDYVAASYISWPLTR